LNIFLRYNKETGPSQAMEGTAGRRYEKTRIVAIARRGLNVREEQEAAVSASALKKCLVLLAWTQCRWRFNALLAAWLVFCGANCGLAQVAVRIPDKDFFVTSVSHFGDETWLATWTGAYRIKGNSPPQRIPDMDSFVELISHFGDETWLATTMDGAYRIKGDSPPQRILVGHASLKGLTDAPLTISNGGLLFHSISHFGDETWLATLDGAYRIKGDSPPQRIPDMDISIQSISHFGDETWLATEHGAYRVKGDAPAKRIPDMDISIQSISRFGGETWLATEHGAYRIKGDAPAKRIPDKVIPVRSISHFGDETWLATLNGAYRIKGNAPAKRIPDKDFFVMSISHFGDETWLATLNGAYRIKGDSPPQRIPDMDISIQSIFHFGDETWLATEHGAYRIKGDVPPQRIPDIDISVQSISHFDDETWSVTQHGAYRVKGNSRPQRIPDMDISIQSISRFGDETWLATEHGVYRIKGDAPPQRIPDMDISVQSISNFGDETWLATSKGAYRIDSDVIISVFAVGVDSLWKRCLQTIMPGNLWISGQLAPSAQYQRLSNHQDPYPKSSPRQFTFVMEKTQEEFDRRYKENFLEAKYASQTVGSGECTLFLAARDQWGNTFKCDPFPIRGWAIPGARVIPVLSGVFWLGILALTMALAPFNTFCHDLLMNPFVRKYGSFGFVPLAITVFPPVRRHLLRRYFNRISRDEGFRQLQQSYIVPTEDFLPEKFGEGLKNYNPVLLLGSSGIGKTSYFRYLTFCYASSRHQKLQPRGVVPVFVPLARYQGAQLEAMFHAQLANYGRLTDEKLTEWFLKQGGFLLFLDGINEVDDATRKRVNPFIDQHKNSSYFCLSSQQSYQEYAWMKTVRLASLNPDKIQALLKRQLGEEKARAVIAQFRSETYEIYAIPQDLQLAMAIVSEGKPLPQSKRELYAESLAPVFEEWTRNGQGDFQDLLTSRAYVMLCTHDPFFDQTNSPLPVDLTGKLVEKRILIKRGDRLLFQHDLVRAYLASQYFVEQWKAIRIPPSSHVTSKWAALLAGPSVKVDLNWRSMLEFTILEVATPEATKDLLLAVLNKNRQLAAELFKWAKELHPNLVEGWEEEFNRAYGKVSLE
jgi:hypothetical protein